jgi:hypothetical protein
VMSSLMNFCFILPVEALRSIFPPFAMPSLFSPLKRLRMKMCVIATYLT